MKHFGSLALFLSILQAALAGTDLPISLASDAEAKINITSPFTKLPFCGYAPVAVHISNDSLRPQRWRFQFQSPTFSFGSTSSVTFNTDLELPGKSARTFNLLVPLAARPTESYFSPLGVTVSGPWTSVSSTAQFPIDRSGKPPSAFIAMSDSLAADCWSKIEKELDRQKLDLAGTRFVPNEFPDDWRALVGVAGIWIGGNELRALSSGQRSSLHDWVCRGGSLVVVGAGEPDPQFAETGFGKVSALPEQLLDIGQMITAIDELEHTSLQHQLNSSYGSDWKVAADFSAIKINAPLLIGFMVMFAALAGPVNLFVFAGRTRRHRLFWTTPVFSIAASILLLVLIVLQDGFGGSGLRVGLIHVSPAQNRTVVLQEQIARTGVVLSSSFQTRDPSFIAPIALGTSRRGPSRKYQNVDTKFSGQWFVSRALQPHWLESVAPSRAGVVLVNAGQTGNADTPPIIVSNISAVLDEFYFRDATGRGWSAHNVYTGQRVTLATTTQMPDLLPVEAGARLRTMWDRVNENKNYFYATSKNSASLVATLPSIGWRDDRLIYFGPLSSVSP